MPTAFAMIAHEARDGRTAKVRVRTPDGTRLVAHVSPLDRYDGSVAIVVTAATGTRTRQELVAHLVIAALLWLS
ncbi:hypothetical protein [Kibdelosporangium phytohabitans]|uniref:Uncharacterized protein n=1 Tax=Kibdelosporangium phytohabitans TaxID=860235 RepID=A0A0N9IEB9_9PSEU|nr:hypothetical protein [Kibdelosporangium phytohabitans]ALG13501.1 hypothetical protein AOZ06_47500 [Kibdelosporangium phytohabitans]MBE1465351.1 hypothetical protein [Kibdelosporangium phytohabitans]